jgi:hypothetical protein
MAAEHYVFHGVHVAEKLNILKRAGNTQSGDVIRLQTIDGVVLEPNRPLIRLIDAVDTVKQGGLTGPVRTDDGINLTALDLKRNILQGRQTPKGNHKILNIEKSHSGYFESIFKSSTWGLCPNWNDGTMEFKAHNFALIFLF